MEEIHVNDLRVKGSYFTLHPAACEHGADYWVVLDLLTSIKDYATKINPSEENPLIPLTFPKNVLTSEKTEYFLEQSLITTTQESNTFSLTEKMITILTAAMILQNKLDGKEFDSCPRFW